MYNVTAMIYNIINSNSSNTNIYLTLVIFSSRKNDGLIRVILL